MGHYARTLKLGTEKQPGGRKTTKERVTINVCANASGSIKLPLVMIGSAKCPRAFKNIDINKLPVKYYPHKNSWMDTTIFKDWFFNEFVPRVIKELKKIEQEPKALLFLDNCPAHPDESELRTKDGNIRAIFFPTNVTSVLQPMDQGVIALLKRRYKRDLMKQMILFADGKEENFNWVDFIKTVDLLKVADLMSCVWEGLEPKILQSAWKPVGLYNENPVMELSSENTETDIRSILTLLAPGENFGDSIEQWLSADSEDVGYEHLDDDTIVANILHNDCSNVSSIDPESEDEIQEIPRKTSHKEAFSAFEVALKWLEEQEEATNYSVSLLKTLKNLSASKRFETLKQCKMTDFINK